jgi:predicted nucleic acid-binding protein
VTVLAGRRVYLDANFLIYFFDEDPRWLSTVGGVLAAAQRSEFVAMAGDAVVAEVMVRPYRSRDPERIARFRDFFALDGVLQVVSHTGADFDLAAQIRAERPLPTMDALHLATAHNAGCTVLVTNDQRMPSLPGLEIVRLQELEQLSG